MRKEQKFWKNIYPWFSLRGPITFLEVGVFRGTTSALLLENIPACKLVGIDPWERSFFDRHDVRDDAAWSGILASIEGIKEKYAGRVAFIKGYSGPVLRNLSGIEFDGIYIDGEHKYAAVIADFNLCWPLLKKGGVLIFDDYLLRDRKSKKFDMQMQYAIDEILFDKRAELELLFKNEQVGIRKL